MRPKRKAKRLSHEGAVAIVRGYHLEGKTQASLAAEHNVCTGYASLVAHGDARPEAFREVFPEGR